MQTIPIRLESVIRIRRDLLPPEIHDLLRRRLVFKNPLFGRTTRFGEPVKREIPPTLEAIWEREDDLVIAKGYLEETVRILHAHRLTPELVVDSAVQPSRPYAGGLHFESAGLDAEQSRAVEEMGRHRFGILEGLPGAGKRLCVIKLAIRKQLTMLVIVHTKAEMYQWRELALRKDNGIQEVQVGLLGDGLLELDRPITIATEPSLWKHFDSVLKTVGLLVVDRCNYAGWSAIFKTRFFNCAAQWGLASGPRSDGITGLMEAYLGPRIVKLQSKSLLPALRVINTEFDFQGGEWEETIKAMIQDVSRNKLIATDLLQEAAKDRRCIVVSDRIVHLECLHQEMIMALGPEVAILHGRLKDQEVAAALSRFNVGKLRILAVPFKSVPLLDPIKKVDCFFVAAPLKQVDPLLQVISKMGEGGAVYEYRDRTPALRFSLGRRMRVYRRMGIK